MKGKIMQQALQGVAVSEPSAPEGLVREGGEWYYKEFPRGGGVTSLGTGASAQGNTSDLPAADEKRKILDLFKN